MPADSIPNVNCLWGEVVAGTLARLGLRHAVISPGSRSAPLVWGFTRQKEIECIPVLDERSAAFYALGLAKSTARPVALVSTSGTAAANFFPAIIEASLNGTPLLVLTADRPPELRDCHAGQAIDQVKLYGHYPRWQHELALPENKPELLRYLRQTMVHAWERAWHPWPGPVHLNFPFREPLAPVSDGPRIARSMVKSLLPAAGLQEITALAGTNTAIQKILENAKKARRGLVVAGALAPQPARQQSLLMEGLHEMGWPVLADALNPSRHDERGGSNVIASYECILRDPARQRALDPDFVVQFGPPPTSKTLRQWLGRCAAPVIVVSDRPGNADPSHRDSVHWRVAPFAAAKSLGQYLSASARHRGYLRRWQKLARPATKSLQTRLDETGWLFEGKAAWLLSQKLPAGTPVFAASSMPVRDCEFFWEAGRGQAFYCNRGANGIDGTASTALGVAHGQLAPAVLLTGDLALLHDQNGLLAARELPRGASLTIVCINNDGGGIFEHLPIAQFDPPFERFFATPQGVDFQKLAAVYGLDFHRPKTWAEFESALLPLPKSGLRLIELRTDRKRDAAFRKKLFREIARELERVKV